VYTALFLAIQRTFFSFTNPSITLLSFPLQ
jgi:hypothetical protein